ncbi:hypothetical protein [Thalassomonas actiniarum]|uniref:Uncharacterized protein n=1 Tax=Thalassomonas actiniarum TaxID=485447 RepID=A0AAE9YWP0_9GAMM|nr:hypothetical protein [Thalassomonas actiniarum]WDE02545.1 hypothetical protein SG35_029515 [Thalassomonas actiniarum]
MSESTHNPEENATKKGKTAGKTDTATAGEKQTAKQLKADMLLLCDEFSQFNEECAFICDAFAAIVREPEALDQATIAGFSHYSIWLKEQVADFKHRIHKVHQELEQ